MSAYKITGACTKCDAMCFHVLQTEDDGTPKRLGPPLDGSVRIVFMLMDGTQMGLTFCGGCASTLSSGDYSPAWTKVMNSWLREIGDKPTPDWLVPQYQNGLLSEIVRQPWTEIVE